jgi:hypothetical protein
MRVEPRLVDTSQIIGQPKEDLHAILMAYNFAKRLKILLGLTPYASATTGASLDANADGYIP